MMNRIGRFVAIAFLAVAALILLDRLLEGFTLPGLPDLKIYPIVVALALAGLGYLAYVSASSNVAAWGWPRAIVVLAVIGLVGYVLWEYRTGAAKLDQIATGGGGGAVNAPPVPTDIPIREPGDIVQEATTSWDPSKPPLKAEGKAPAFASAVPDDHKPFGGDVSRARWCKACGSGNLSRGTYEAMGCDPNRCK